MSSTTTDDPFALAHAIEPDPPLCATDADFLAAERQIAELRDERERLCNSLPVITCEDEKRLIDPLSDRLWALYQTITLSPPMSLTSVAVKLRLLTHPAVGLDLDEGDSALLSLRQVREFIEREARP